jgi:hypothetical protein
MADLGPGFYLLETADPMIRRGKNCKSAALTLATQSFSAQPTVGIGLIYRCDWPRSRNSPYMSVFLLAAFQPHLADSLSRFAAY